MNNDKNNTDPESTKEVNEEVVKDLGTSIETLSEQVVADNGKKS
jgi:hypothetical protein